MNFISVKEFIPTPVEKPAKIGRPSKEKAIKPRKVDALLRKGKNDSYQFIIFKHAIASIVSFLNTDLATLNEEKNVDLLLDQANQYSGSSESLETKVTQYFTGNLALSFGHPSEQPFSLVKYSAKDDGGRKLTLKAMPKDFREACYFLEHPETSDQQEIIFTPDYSRALPELGKRGRKKKGNDNLSDFLDTPLTDQEREIVDQFALSGEETVASNTTVEDNGTLLSEPTLEYPINAVDLPASGSSQPAIARKSHHKAKKA